MQGNVLKHCRKTSQTQNQEAFTIPEYSEELLDAERKHNEITAELAAARADCETLTSKFNVLGLTRGDGTRFPSPGDGRNAALAELHFKIVDLEATREQARRNAAEARRAFEENVSRDIAPAADAVCEEAIEHVEAAMRLVEMLSEISTEAKKRGLTIRHHQIARADNLARQLHQVRGTLAPVPTMGVRL